MNESTQENYRVFFNVLIACVISASAFFVVNSYHGEDQAANRLPLSLLIADTLSYESPSAQEGDEFVPNLRPVNLCDLVRSMPAAGSPIPFHCSSGRATVRVR